MPSKAQLKARADFVKNYAKKKKGSKTKGSKPYSYIKNKGSMKEEMIRVKGSKSSKTRRVTKAGKLDQRSAIPDSVMIRAIKNGLDWKKLPSSWYMKNKTEKMAYLKKYL
jgi:hypothetical protein